MIQQDRCRPISDMEREVLGSCPLTHSRSDSALVNTMNFSFGDADLPSGFLAVESFFVLFRASDHRQKQGEAKPNDDTSPQPELRRVLLVRSWLRHLVHESLRDPQNRIASTPALLNL